MNVDIELARQYALQANQAKNIKPVIIEFSQKTGYSEQHAYRILHNAGMERKRKVRSDAGQISPELRDVLFDIAAIYHRSAYPLEQAISEYLRSKEYPVNLPSVSHIHNLFRKLGISRKHKKAPPPSSEIRSLYANHCHQYDTSVCRYYLDPDNTIIYMDPRDHYKNKPANRRKRRLVRMVMIDHCSGAFFVQYALSEQIIDHAEFFYNAWRYKDDFIFHGVPAILIMDNASALRSFTLIRLLTEYMEIVIPNVKAYKARVKGSVERMMYDWEVFFESRFLYLEQKVADINQINEWAYELSKEFQSTRIHSRHKKTRFDAWNLWLENLRELPSWEMYQRLLYRNPQTRDVGTNGILRYNNIKYKVEDVELRGHKVLVIESPFLYEKNQAITVLWPTPEYSKKNLITPEKKKYTIEPIVKDQKGFNSQAPAWLDYENIPETMSQMHLNEIEKRDIKVIDPFKTGKKEIKTIHMPRKGKQIQVKENDYTFDEIKYSLIQAKMKIADMLYRGLETGELEHIDGLGKETFTENEINELTKLFKVQKSLKKEAK